MRTRATGLKKWRKGGLIGFGAGLVLGALTSPLAAFIPPGGPVSTGLMYAHFAFAVIVRRLHPGPTTAWGFEHFIMPLCMVALYTGFGAALGRVRQIHGRSLRRDCTAGLAALLLMFYAASFAVLQRFAGGF